MYLGIKIGKLPSSIYHLNYPPLIKKISQELGNWMDLPLSLLGRCHLVKMVSFACLLYPLQMIPLLLQHKDMQSLNKAISKFIWQNKRPRIAFTKLHLPRQEGGINPPNVRLYNLACLLWIGLDWIAQSSHYSNYSLEPLMAHPYTLVALLHCKWKSIPVPFQHNLLLRDTAIAWREVRKCLKLSPFMSRHLTIQGNPHFPPGMDHKPFHICEQKSLTKFSTLCNMETAAPTISQLSPKHSPSPKLMLSTSVNASTSFGTHVERAVRDSKCNLPIYYSKLAHTRYPISTNPFCKNLFPSIESSSAANWSKDFPVPDIVDKLLLGYNKIQQLIPNEAWRETQLKILHRAYIPFLSVKNNSDAAKCPLYHQSRPSLAHRFGHAPSSPSSGTKSSPTSSTWPCWKIPKDPLLLIFGYWDVQLLPWSPNSHLPYKNWALICLLIARRVILKNWTF